VFHPTWLANLVLVKKKNGKWRMCVDYTSLNKARPKVPFPLPRIDQIVDSTAGCELLCFLNAYSEYHQIKMKESDQHGLRRRRGSLILRRGLCPTSSSTTKHSTLWVLAPIYTICWGTLDGCSSPTEYRWTPTWGSPWKF
jgi:hypothetical protein